MAAGEAPHLTIIIDHASHKEIIIIYYVALHAKDF